MGGGFRLSARTPTAIGVATRRASAKAEVRRIENPAISKDQPPHAVQLPPQSTPVSLAFFTQSLHVGT
jgi:hypothetical protein